VFFHAVRVYSEFGIATGYACLKFA
jgi:hypothetical protein